jgi:hypothetical protein
MAALAARRMRVLAQEHLGEPERDTLLSAAARTMQQQALRKRASSRSAAEAIAKRLVSVEWDEWHSTPGNLPTVCARE